MQTHIFIPEFDFFFLSLLFVAWNDLKRCSLSNNLKKKKISTWQQLYLRQHWQCWRLLSTQRPLGERICQWRRQLGPNECDSAGVSDDECVSPSLDLPARNLARVTRLEESINQLCSLQIITGSYRPDGNFALEHPAAQVWLMRWMMTLVHTLGFLAAFFSVWFFLLYDGWKWMRLLFHENQINFYLTGPCGAFVVV